MVQGSGIQRPSAASQNSEQLVSDELRRDSQREQLMGSSATPTPLSRVDSQETLSECSEGNGSDSPEGNTITFSRNQDELSSRIGNAEPRSSSHHARTAGKTGDGTESTTPPAPTNPSRPIHRSFARMAAPHPAAVVFLGPENAVRHQSSTPFGFKPISGPRRAIVKPASNRTNARSLGRIRIGKHSGAALPAASTQANAPMGIDARTGVPIASMGQVLGRKATQYPRTMDNQRTARGSKHRIESLLCADNPPQIVQAARNIRCLSDLLAGIPNMQQTVHASRQGHHAPTVADTNPHRSIHHRGRSIYTGNSVNIRNRQHLHVLSRGHNGISRPIVNGDNLRARSVPNHRQFASQDLRCANIHQRTVRSNPASNVSRPSPIILPFPTVTPRAFSSQTHNPRSPLQSDEAYKIAPLRVPEPDDPIEIPKLPPPIELLALPPLRVEQQRERLRLPATRGNPEAWRVQLPMPPIMMRENEWKAMLHAALHSAAASAGSVLNHENMEIIAKMLLRKSGMPQTVPRDADVKAAEEAAVEHIRMGCNPENASLIASLARLISDIRKMGVSRRYTK